MKLPQPGNLFAEKYRIVRPLAEGGMGAVYVARHETTERQVALKVLWSDVLRREEAVERFGFEAKVSAKVKSEHIVQVFDAGFDEESQMPFLVMELLEGKSLQDLVRDKGPLQPALVADLMEQAARGLGRAHNFTDSDGVITPIVHRDLKPENLFVTQRDTGEPLVKVLDFGIAKVLNDSTLVSQNIKGTPLYIASEQALGQAVSPRTDIWALGLISYFLLTGQPYWRSAQGSGRDLSALLTEITILPIVAPSKRQAEVECSARTPKAYDDWFLKCVNRNVEERFASAEEAASALRSALGVTDEKSDRQEDLGLAVKPREPRPAATSADLMTSTAPVSATLQALEHPAATPASTLRPPRRPKTMALGLFAALVVVGVAFWVASRNKSTEPEAGPLASSEALQQPAQPAASGLPKQEEQTPQPVVAQPVVAGGQPSAAPSASASAQPSKAAPSASPVRKSVSIPRSQKASRPKAPAPRAASPATTAGTSDTAQVEDPFFDRRR